MGTLTTRQLELLRLVHARPGVTRAGAAETLRLGSGAVATLVQSLAAAELLDERPAPPSGGRGRPTRELVAHPRGPVVLAAVVTHAGWRVSVVEIGATEVASVAGDHDGRDGPALVALLASAAAEMAARFRGRVRGMGLAVPGVVRGAVLLDAPFLGFRDVDLDPVWPGPGPLVVGNDATYAALGEVRRGAATGAAMHLHLHLDAGLGGAVTVRGDVLAGAGGAGGEFGHMPFGDPDVTCACGATGCWTTCVSARGLASTLGEALPLDEVGYARSVVERARRGDSAALAAVQVVAGGLGRGIAGLVNALDVDLITLGGLAPALAELAATDLAASFHRGLMQVHRGDPPGITTATLGDDAPRTGTAEQVWSRVWSGLGTLA